ncbi:MAG: DUF72 domain-containing protein [Bacteroidota bacterium]
MKFGKLSDITTVDFRLAETEASNADFLAPVASERLAVYVGCTGWGMPQWVARWYPKGTKSKDFLAAYAQQFNTIELNTTHYRIPDGATVDKWCTAVPADFRFCPKVPQRISHSKQLGLGGDQLPLFWESLARFASKLGASFMQLPPYFGFDRLAQLQHFLSIWPAEYPLSVEFRHESWFADEQRILDWSAMLREEGVGAVITDVAGRRDVLHDQITQPFSVVRFVGNGLVPSDFRRADAWVARMLEWQKIGLSDLYFFPHQPDNVHAPEMCAYLVEQLQARGLNTRGPQLIKASDEGQQISLF